MTNILTKTKTKTKQLLLREEYTGRWTNLNIFTGALALRRMVEITKPDGEVIHHHHQHHNTFCINFSLNRNIVLLKKQECGAEGDFLSWLKVIFLHFSPFPACFFSSDVDVICVKFFMHRPPKLSLFA